MNWFRFKLLAIAGIAVLYLLAQVLTYLAALGMALDYARSGSGGPPPSLERTIFETAIEVLALPLGLFFAQAKEPDSWFGLLLVLSNSILWGVWGYAVGAGLYRLGRQIKAKRHPHSINQS